MSAGPIAIVAPLREELGPTRRRLRGRRDVVLRVVGDGSIRSAEACERLLDECRPRAVILIGVAGALTPDLEPACVCVAETLRAGWGRWEPDPEWLRRASALPDVRRAHVLTAAHLVATPADKAALARDMGVVPACVDLESAWVAGRAIRRHIPWLVLRAISDTASEGLPRFFVACQREDGSLDRWKLVRSSLLRPRRLRALRVAQKRVRACAERLADVVEALLSRA